MKIETETIINFNAFEEDAHIYTAMARIKTKMGKLGIKPYKKIGDGFWYRIPKACISIRNPNKRRTGVSNGFKKAQFKQKSAL